MYIAATIFPARARIHENTGFPCIKYGAGPEHHAVQGRLSQARNDNLHKTYVIMYNTYLSIGA